MESKKYKIINNKIINKKSISLILIFMFLVILSGITYAKPFTNAFEGGLININNFFEAREYEAYSKTIDFFFFTLLFIAIYMMGARYAFKEVKRPEQAIVILLGLMTSILLVIAGISATILLPYIHWIFYILLFILYWWLLKGIKNKFWRFLLALLLTLLTIALFQGLFNALTSPTIEERKFSGFGRFFRGFGESFDGIKFEGAQTPGIGDYFTKLFGDKEVTSISPTGEEVVTPAQTPIPAGTKPEQPPTTQEQPEKKFNKNWLWMFLLPLLVFLLYRYGGRLFKEKKLGKELTIEQILSEIENYLNKKKEALINIYYIYKTKKELTEELIDLYHKTIYNVEPVNLLDPENETHKKFLKEGSIVNDLIKAELKLGNQLEEILGIEQKLSGSKKGGDVNKWKILLEKKFAQELLSTTKTEYRSGYAKLMNYLSNLDQVTTNAKLIIQNYFLLTKVHIKKEKELKKLLDPDELEAWIKTTQIERWSNLIETKTRESRDFSKISKYTKIDETSYLKTELFPGINKERKYLKYIEWLIKFLQSKAEIKTLIQDLVVEPKEAKELTGVTYGTPIKISTKIAQGIGPFKAYCFVYMKIPEVNLITGQIVKEELVQIYPEGSPNTPISKLKFKPFAKILDEIIFSSEDFGNLKEGDYEVVFFVRGRREETSPVEEKRYGWDRKSIKIYVQRTEIPTPESQLQELTIKVQEWNESKKEFENEWKEAKIELTQPKTYEIIQNVPIQVSARLFNVRSPIDIYPIKCICYVDKSKIGDEKEIKNENEAIEFEITKYVSLLPGLHRISLFAISPKGSTYKRRALRKCIIHIVPSVPSVSTPTIPTTPEVTQLPPIGAIGAIGPLIIISPEDDPEGSHPFYIGDRIEFIVKIGDLDTSESVTYTYSLFKIIYNMNMKVIKLEKFDEGPATPKGLYLPILANRIGVGTHKIIFGLKKVFPTRTKEEEYIYSKNTIIIWVKEKELEYKPGTFSLLKETKETLIVKINRPVENSVHFIGDSIKNLEAEAVGLGSDIINSEGNSKDANISFIWIIFQGEKKQVIHKGRISDQSSGTILSKFTKGNAELRVYLFDEKQNGLFKVGITKIRLENKMSPVVEKQEEKIIPINPLPTRTKGAYPPQTY